MHAVVRAVVSAPTQFFEKPLRRAALALGQIGLRFQNLRQSLNPLAELRRRLNVPSVLELCLVASDDLADRRARHRKRPHDLLDRPPLLEIGASKSRRSCPRQPSPSALPGRSGPKGRTLTHNVGGGRYWTRKPPLRGSLLQAILQPWNQRVSLSLAGGFDGSSRPNMARKGFTPFPSRSWRSLRAWRSGRWCRPIPRGHRSSSGL